MNQPKTHLGTPELHKRHSVMIEGGKVPRAKVMDQIMIDRYLMRGLITLPQHRGGEVLLRQASKAGLYPRGVDVSSVSGGGRGSRPNYVPFGAFPFGRTLVRVRQRYGQFHAYVVREVVCYNWDVSKDDYRMECLREGLDLICNLQGSGRRLPLQKLQDVVQKKGPVLPGPSSE